MSSEYNEQLELLDNLVVNILFCAAPKYFVNIKRNKKTIKNAFYNIFGLYIQNTNQYVVFLKIFTLTRKKYTNNLYADMKYNDTIILNSKEEVFTYLSNFMLDMEEHKRFLNEEIVNQDDISGAQAVFTMSEWQKIIIDYFKSI
jgi:hypothetical protein